MVQLQHPEGRVILEPLETRTRVRVQLADPERFSPCLTWDSGYSTELIKMILDLKGPAYLCDELRRDEDPSYVEFKLMSDLTGYLPEEAFAEKTIFDFGCGSGASSIILARRLPAAKIIGVDLSEKYLAVARARAAFHNVQSKIHFISSPGPNELPPEVEMVDFVIMSAVYEHLLPAEREIILRKVWGILKPGGILFLDQTPYRFWPYESHTTGLLFINYLPDNLAYKYAQCCSRRVQKQTWADLLREGIRGGSPGEIMNIIKNFGGHANLLEPERRGFKDRVDLWHALLGDKKFVKTKKLIRTLLKTVRLATGVTMVPVVALAIRKER